MIDFKDEIRKYAPVLTVDDVEIAVNDEIRDVMDLLQHITRQMKNSEDTKQEAMPEWANQESKEGVEADDLSQLQ